MRFYLTYIILTLSSTPINILERYWNFTAFRGLQEPIINAVLNGDDVFALMPTGGGKSICFQVPTLIKPGICIVISPLIALMQDQIENLKLKGIKALAITSGISKNELDTLLDNCIYGNYKFLYLSPERLQQDIVKERIKQMHVNLIVVDEAHCISQWGNDFRPAYSKIANLRQLQPTVNLIALTATAKPNVVTDIIKGLDFINPKVFQQSFFRPNLAYIVLHEEDKYYKLQAILKKHSGASIIYVRNRKATVETNDLLNRNGITSTYYHGGLDAAERKQNMKLWMNNQTQVIVATTAFGMGIDKPDVKTVIHLNLPESLESYFQEAGRAGRNGDAAYAVILKNKNDDETLKNQFLNILPNVDTIKMIYKKLCAYFQISYGEGTYAVFDFDFNTFCKTYNLNRILSYNALLTLDRNSIISLNNTFKNKATVQFIASHNKIFDYIEDHPETGLIIKSILRSYGGIFDFETEINLSKISTKSGADEQTILKTLNKLHKQDIIEFNFNKTDAQIMFIEPREDDRTINRIANTIMQQNELKSNQVYAVLNYVENDTVCKSMTLLKYFGEKNLSPCGICSVCRNMEPNKTDILTTKSKIVALLEHGNKSSRQIGELLKLNDTETKHALKLLLEHQIISLTKTNTYKLNNNNL